MFNHRERRYRLVFLQPELILECFYRNTINLPGCVAKIALDVPEGTEVVTQHYDHLKQSEVFLLYNKAWDVVPEAEAPPRLETKIEYINVRVGEYRDLTKIWSMGEIH